MPHIHDAIDFTVEVFIVHEDRVLLRMHDKYGFWLSVGGHIELDEDPNEAAVREVQEEVGLDVTLASDRRPFELESDNYRELIPPVFLNRHTITEGHEHVSLIYFATSKSNQVVQGEREQSDACRWFTTEELNGDRFDVRPTIRYYAKRALAELGTAREAS